VTREEGRDVFTKRMADLVFLHGFTLESDSDEIFISIPQTRSFLSKYSHTPSRSTKDEEDEDFLAVLFFFPVIAIWSRSALESPLAIDKPKPPTPFPKPPLAIIMPLLLLLLLLMLFCTLGLFWSNEFDLFISA
jgi:hypothetical protein